MAVKLVNQVVVFSFDLQVQCLLIESRLFKNFVALSVLFVLLKHGVVVAFQKINHSLRLS